MNNFVFGKAVGNVWKHRDIKQLVLTERRRNYLVSESNYHTTNVFYIKFISNRNEKTEILQNKIVCLGLSILELSKILMHKFCYDYVKPKYCEKIKLCYIDTDSFIVYIKTDYIYKGIAEDIETRFYTLNYELDRRLPKRWKMN